MSLKKYALLTALGTTAIVQPAPASALFGSTCVPRLQNCWCTYLTPCPVADWVTRGTTDDIESTLKKTERTVTDNTKAMRDKTLAMGGDLGGLIPGLNSVGLNFEGLLQSQIDEITGKLEGITGQLENINLAVGDFEKILSGELNPSIIADKISQAGLDALDLQSLGMDPGTINNLLNGNLASGDLLNVASTLGLEGDLLKGIGVTPDALRSLADGTLSLSDLEGQIMSAANLNLDDLAASGINVDALRSLASGAGEAQIMSVIGDLGIGDLSSLPSISQLRSIIDGDIDASAIFSLAGAAGFDMSQLESMGINPGTLDALISGNFTPDQIIELSSAIGLGGEALQSFGINAGIIMNIANGEITPESIIHIAQQAGVSTDALRIAGIDIADIAAIAQSGSIADALNLLEQAGIAENPLAGLSISTAQLAGVIDGSISPREIGAILAQNGIDPSAIILPTADGIPVNGFGEIVDNLQTSFNIPVDSISGLRDALNNATFDLDRMASLGADDLLAELSTQAGFDLQTPEFFDSLIAGNINSSDLMSFLDAQGLGSDQLASIGVLSDTISALESGNFSAEQLVNFSKSLGVGGQALEALGIGASALSQVAEGITSPQQFIDLANSLGMSVEALSDLGLSQEALTGVAEAGTQEAAQALADVAASPSAENVDVPVEPDSPLAATTSARPPVPRTPVDIGETCQMTQTLISVQSPPNDFGADVTQIDMAISQGDLTMYEESIEDAIRLSNHTHGNIIARSIQVKNILTDALDSIDYFIEEVHAAKSQDEDHKVNSAIQMQLMMAEAEIASLLTFVLSTESAAMINRENFTATPTFPHDSQWAQTIQQSAQQRSDSISAPAVAASDAAEEYTNFDYQASEASSGLEALQSYNGMQDAMPALTDSIMHHEEVKGHLYHLESLVRGVASSLYTEEDQDRAAALILDALRNAAGSSDDQARWEQSNTAALSIESAVVSMNSPYGTRKTVTVEGERGTVTVPSTPGQMPYNYPMIDNASGHAPYDIVRHEATSGGAEGDSVPPPPLAGLFQYYMEANRREAHEGEFRRGVAPNTMSLRAWDEFTNFAPECLMGPISSTQSNFTARPDLFDLAPYCQHMTFTGGDIEDYIPSSELGGADSVLWESKIQADIIRLQYGTPAEIIQRAQDVVNGPETQALLQQLRNDGSPELLDRAQSTLSRIQNQLSALGG